MNNIPKADIYCRVKLRDLIFVNKLENDEINEIVNAMLEFAKFHTTLALESASETTINTFNRSEKDKQLILNSYSEQNII